MIVQYIHFWYQKFFKLWKISETYTIVCKIYLFCRLFFFRRSIFFVIYLIYSSLEFISIGVTVIQFLNPDVITAQLLNKTDIIYVIHLRSTKTNRLIPFQKLSATYYKSQQNINSFSTELHPHTQFNFITTELEIHFCAPVAPRERPK